MTTARKNYTPAFKAQIVQELLKEEQTITQIASKHGVHPTQLRRWREAALQAMPDNFQDEERYQKRLTQLTEEHEREKEKLYAEIGKLTTQLNCTQWVPEKKLQVAVSRPNRVKLVEREGSELPLLTQAPLLGLSRSSLYYRKSKTRPGHSPKGNNFDSGRRGESDGLGIAQVNLDLSC